MPINIYNEENHILINPLHPLMSQVKVTNELPFMIDQRMYPEEEDSE